MRRIAIEPRAGWQAKIEETGLTYHAENNHWREDAAYEFTADEVDAIEAASSELHGLCLKAVDYIAAHPAEIDAFAIPQAYRDYVLATWRRGDPCLMGRFDLAFDPATLGVKLLEYNADTPTLVIETALTQWYWLQDKFPDADQFNSLHEKLLARLTEIGAFLPPGQRLYFAAMPDAAEEVQHCTYLIDLAQQANIPAEFIAVPDIGWQQDTNGKPGGFVDLSLRSIRFLHKLYPWEWLANESFGAYMPRDQVGVVEPAWKMLLSNKAILPLLWRLFPGHPNLLPSFWSASEAGPDHVAKPILAREGANISVVQGGAEIMRTGGNYGGVAPVYQHLASLPVFEGRYAVIGSWMVNDQPAGMIVREGPALVTGTESNVVPHYFVDTPP